MIGRLNHVAIVVEDLNATTRKYRNLLGAKVTEPENIPEHGVTVVFIELENTKIELMSPFGEGSPIASFLRKRGGGIHHLCYEVPSIEDACDKLMKQGCKILGDGKPRIGAHGKPIIFLHPSEFDGTLIELEEV